MLYLDLPYIFGYFFISEHIYVLCRWEGFIVNFHFIRLTGNVKLSSAFERYPSFIFGFSQCLVDSLKNKTRSKRTRTCSVPIKQGQFMYFSLLRPINYLSLIQALNAFLIFQARKWSITSPTTWRTFVTVVFSPMFSRVTWGTSSQIHHPSREKTGRPFSGTSTGSLCQG